MRYLTLGKPKLRLLGCLVAATTMASCATLDSAFESMDRFMYKVSDEVKHHSFNYDDVVNGGIAIVGVINKQGDINVDRSKTLSAYFGSNVLKRRPNFDLSSGHIVSTQIGDFAYESVISEYQLERWIGETNRRSIRNADSTPRYLLVASIDHDYEEEKTSVSKNPSREDDGLEYSIKKSTERMMDMSFDVIDLAQDIIVWSGTINCDLAESGETIKTNNQNRQYDLRSVLAPTDQKMMELCSDRIAAHMPRVSK